MRTPDLASRPKAGLVMTGGGARAAYQVGVLRAVSELVPPGAPTPFQIVCGTSAGAINATAIAADATNFRRAVRRLGAVWENFRAHHVYRSDVAGIGACGARWLTALMLGGLGRRNPVSLLDNSPLQALLARELDFDGLQRSIDHGALTALSVTASGYTSGESISFFQGHPSLAGWRRARRVGVPADIAIPHLMASAAIPFVFPPVRIHREYFGDGSMRQIAPISPALHLGAERVMVISVAKSAEARPQRVATEYCPSLAQIGGHALSSIFLDALEADIERLTRINRTVSLIPPELRDGGTVPLKHVDCIVLSPSQEIERIALAHVHALPRAVRFFLRGIGAMRRSGSALASYVLFERSFCGALMRLGYDDTMARRDEVLSFLAAEGPRCPVGPGAAAPPANPPVVAAAAATA